MSLYYSSTESYSHLFITTLVHNTNFVAGIAVVLLRLYLLHPPTLFLRPCNLHTTRSKSPIRQTDSSSPRDGVRAVGVTAPNPSYHTYSKYQRTLRCGPNDHTTMFDYRVCRWRVPTGSGWKMSCGRISPNSTMEDSNRYHSLRINERYNIHSHMLVPTLIFEVK
jgi:hypothetical protein